jgi:hypothetical protein
MDNGNKLAVLIDADNAQPGIVDSLLAEIANYGIARGEKKGSDSIFATQWLRIPVQYLV